jgi:predicted dehydrogenase
MHDLGSNGRRAFLAQGALGAIGLAMSAARACGQEGPAAPSAPAAPAGRAAGNELRLAVIGVRSRGWEHVQMFSRAPGCRVVALCDVDAEVLARRAADCATGSERREGFEVETFGDVRALLARDDVDAVSIATPNHTHAMLACWALAAGKHAYVEKPVSHVVDEGARIVEAARASGKVCATGTQARSSSAVQAAIRFIHEGGLGAVHCSRGICFKPRRPIGRVAGPRFAPSPVDYDRWLGPVAYRALRRANLHYDWHWDLHTGNGDLGNQGIHQMDVARWALGWDRMPDAVRSIGGRFGDADDGDSPNTQVVSFDCGGTPLVFEVRGLPRDRAQRDGKWEMDRYEGMEIGNVVHGEKGTVRISNSYTAAAFFDRDGRMVEEWKGGGDHFANFVEAARAGDPARLAAPIAEGHLSSAFCHYGILSHRVGSRPMPANPAAIARLADEACAGDAALAEAWARMRAHLAANEVLESGELVIGRRLRIAADGGVEGDAEATALLSRACREPFVF